MYDLMRIALSLNQLIKETDELRLKTPVGNGAHTTLYQSIHRAQFALMKAQEHVEAALQESWIIAKSA